MTAQAQPGTFPDLIYLPDGFRPEGIALGFGHTAFAGSLQDGSVYQADLRTGEGSLIVPPQDGRIAVGLAFDRRSELVFVAGGNGGTGYVYDTEDGTTVDVYDLAATIDTFVNDVVITRNAAFFTDSFAPVLYRLPLGPRGELPDQSQVTSIPLSGDFEFIPDAFNANGIESTANGEWLIMVHTARGELYRVDPDTGDAKLIDLAGGSVPNGDGLVLAGRTLYVVQNRLNQIAVIELTPDLEAGEIVALLTSSGFDIPTTAAGFGDAIYAVNARFGTTLTPDTEYQIVRVLK